MVAILLGSECLPFAKPSHNTSTGGVETQGLARASGCQAVSTVQELALIA